MLVPSEFIGEKYSDYDDKCVGTQITHGYVIVGMILKFYTISFTKN